MTKAVIHQAFFETNYIVTISNEKSITLNVNTTSEELEKQFPNLQSWCFITAWNPLPEVLALEENKKRNQLLENDIQNLGLKYLKGIGISADENWSEESFFILDCPLQIAKDLAIKYGQLAFLYGEKKAEANLVYLK